MIKINRNDVKIPDVLRTDIVTIGMIETARAIDFFQDKVKRRVGGSGLGNAPIKAQKEPRFEFKVYGEAKGALRLLFRDKCGYCEIDYGGAAREVEHYRPVGRIDYLDNGVKNVHSEGYYWLGTDWDNLILSCSHCNKLEAHWHQEQAYARRVKRVSGKGNFFTLEDENTRATPLSSVENELPLLLNPCVDNPREHLDFRENGLVHPKLINDRPSRKGQESIKVYGLRRLELVEKRKEIARTLLLAIDRLNRKVATCKAQPNDKEAREDVSRIFSTIREHYLTRDKPFLALALSLYATNVEREDIKKLSEVRATTNSPK